MVHITRQWDLNFVMGSLRISSLREIFSDRGANNHSPVLKEKGNNLVYIM